MLSNNLYFISSLDNVILFKLFFLNNRIVCVTMEQEWEFQGQHVLMKLLVKTGNMNPEIYSMMAGFYGDHLVKISKFFKRLDQFRDGQTCTKNGERVGRPSSIRNDIWVEFLFRNGSLRVRLLILLSTVASWSVCVKEFGKRRLICGRTARECPLYDLALCDFTYFPK